MTNKSKNPNNFFRNYFNLQINTINQIDIKKIIKISQILERAIKKNKNIFVAGNGGSASVSNHFLCDFNKGIKLSSGKKLKPKVISLTNSIELITAISNDINYNKIFSFQLENYYKTGDVVFVVSCSGTSKNIIDLLKFAKSKKLEIIFISGFNKSNKNPYTKNFINLNCKNYGITEDIFSTFMHMISQWIRYKNSKKKEIL